MWIYAFTLDLLATIFTFALRWRFAHRNAVMFCPYQIQIQIQIKENRKLTTSISISWIWKRKIMVQIKPRIKRGLPSTISSAPIDSRRTWRMRENSFESFFFSSGNSHAHYLRSPKIARNYFNFKSQSFRYGTNMRFHLANDTRS